MAKDLNERGTEKRRRRAHPVRRRVNWTLILEFLAVIAAAYGLVLYFGLPLWIFAVIAAAVLSPLLATRRQGPLDGFVKSVIPIAIGAAFVVAYVEIHKVPEAQIVLSTEFDEFYGEQYYAVLSTLFAIITALILVKGIEFFDRLNTLISEEANQIRSIYEFLAYFEDDESATANPNVRAIKTLLRDYCVMSLENPYEPQGHDPGVDLLRRGSGEIGRLDCREENDKVALAEIMRGLNTLFATRAKRLSCGKAKVPVYMLITLAFMSIAIIFPFFLEDPSSFNHNYAIIFVLATFCSFILLLLLDINSPFDGFWAVDLDAFRRLQANIDEDLDGAVP